MATLTSHNCMITFKELKRNIKKDHSGLTVKKVALIGDTATQLLAIAIKGMGVEKNFSIDLFDADFNQVEQQVLDPTSELHEFEADYTIIFQSTHKLLEKYC